MCTASLVLFNVCLKYVKTKLVAASTKGTPLPEHWKPAQFQALPQEIQQEVLGSKEYARINITSEVLYVVVTTLTLRHPVGSISTEPGYR